MNILDQGGGIDALTQLCQTPQGKQFTIATGLKDRSSAVADGVGVGMGGGATAAGM